MDESWLSLIPAIERLLRESPDSGYIIMAILAFFTVFRQKLKNGFLSKIDLFISALSYDGFFALSISIVVPCSEVAVWQNVSGNLSYTARQRRRYRHILEAFSDKMLRVEVQGRYIVLNFANLQSLNNEAVTLYSDFAVHVNKRNAVRVFFVLPPGNPALDHLRAHCASVVNSSTEGGLTILDSVADAIEIINPG